MAFFKNFQQTFKQNLNLPSMSSIVDSLSNAMDDITSAVGDVSYTVADSVTEQVTSMINIFRTDDTATTQDDKYTVAKEENSTQLNHGKEKHMTEKGYNTELKHSEANSLKETTNGGRKFHLNEDKMQHNLNNVEPSPLLNCGEILKEVNNSVKQNKSDYLENTTFSKNTGQNCSKLRQEESLSKNQSKESHPVLERAKYQFHKNDKERSAGIDFRNTKESHSVPRNLEASEDQTPKLSKSTKVHGAPETKGKCRTLSDSHRQSMMKQEKNVQSIVSKRSTSEKTKESEHFSKEVGSKMTPENDNSYLNKDQHGSSSESEDEALGKYHEALSKMQSSRPAGDNRQQKNYIWETRQKYSPLSAEYDGYSSEGSIDEGKQKEECLWLNIIHEGEIPTQARTLVAEKAGTRKMQKMQKS